MCNEGILNLAYIEALGNKKKQRKKREEVLDFAYQILSLIKLPVNISFLLQKYL